MPDLLFRFLAGIAVSLVILSTDFPIARAQQLTDTTTQYQQRATELLKILGGSEREEDFFADSFRKAVPITQFRGIITQLSSQYGKPIAIKRIIPAGLEDGTVEISYERATLAFRMVIANEAPYPVIGLLVTGVQVAGDDLNKIRTEFESLAGSAGFEIALLSDPGPEIIASFQTNKQFAIGSTFKLYILAELSRSISAGERKWEDVIRLDRASLPSGILQGWPTSTPLTLQTLATLMISISDNTATDILINLLGREAIEDMVRRTGHGAPQRNSPFLTTLESFALKMPENQDLRQRFERGDTATRKSLLEQQQSRLDRDDVRVGNLATTPRHIEAIEWFASPADLTNALGYLRQLDDPVVNAILRVNSIIPPGDALRWSSIGGKGGSEPGVVSFAFLAEAKNGSFYAVSGSWNNPDAPVDNDRFLALMNRLLNIAANRPQ